MKNAEQQGSAEIALAKNLGHNVQSMRKSQNLYKYVLAELSGISRPQLDKIEKGAADVRLSTVQNLADAFCVDPIELFKPCNFDEGDL